MIGREIRDRAVGRASNVACGVTPLVGGCPSMRFSVESVLSAHEPNGTPSLRCSEEAYGRALVRDASASDSSCPWQVRRPRRS